MTDPLIELNEQLVHWTQVMANATIWLVVVSAIAGAGTIAVAIAAFRASRTSVAMAQRGERAAYGQLVLGYFDDHRTDLVSGRNTNMPHYTHAIEGSAAALEYANAKELLAWLTTAMDKISRDSSKTGKSISTHYLRMQLPTIVGEWVKAPDDFAPEPFLAFPDLKRRYIEAELSNNGD